MPACIGASARGATDLRTGAPTTVAEVHRRQQSRYGVSRLTSITANMHRQQISIFDPSIGEYVSQINDMDDVFRDIFPLNPAYARISEVAVLPSVILSRIGCGLGRSGPHALNHHALDRPTCRRPRGSSNRSGRQKMRVCAQSHSALDQPD